MKRKSPVSFSQDLWDTICERIGSGRSLTAICRDDEGMPNLATVYKWLETIPGLNESYERAREKQAETLANEITEIADAAENDTHIDENGRPIDRHIVLGRAKLRIDARKWVAAKLLPKRYGDRVAAEVTGKDGAALIPEPTADDRELSKAILAILTGAVKPGAPTES